MNKVRLGDIAEIITGPFGSMLHKSDYVKKGIPLIMPQDIGDRSVDFSTIARISEEDAERLKKYEVVENDIVYARRGDVEKHAFIVKEHGRIFCGTGCLRVRVKSELANPLFVSFYLNRPESKEWISKHAVGSNMPNINTEILSDVLIELPNAKKQEKIAFLLKQIDEKVKNNKKVNDNLASMAYDIYMHTLYGKEPNGKLNDILIENDKSKVQVGEAKESVGKYPFFTSGEAILRWKEHFVDGRNCFLNTGGNADVKFYVGKAAYSTDTWCISANQDLGDYLYLLLLSIKPELDKKFFQGTSLKHLQKPLLKERPIYIPKVEEIYAFNSQVQHWFDNIAENTKENQHLTSVRNWLLPMLMNGQATLDD
ncbi:MAG: hypothetical protein HDR08_06755 [Lachnospiraceae bacterium]|nr:hypothetical protein [Lachnospiraceae bacterium]